MCKLSVRYAGVTMTAFRGANGPERVGSDCSSGDVLWPLSDPSQSVAVSYPKHPRRRRARLKSPPGSPGSVAICVTGPSVTRRRHRARRTIAARPTPGNAPRKRRSARPSVGSDISSQYVQSAPGSRPAQHLRDRSGGRVDVCAWWSSVLCLLDKLPGGRSGRRDRRC